MPATSVLGPFSPVATPAAPTRPAPKVLTFAMQTQLQDNWCWAAVTASVCAFYPPPRGSPPMRQCEIANTFLGPECCLNPMPAPSAAWPGNREFALETPLRQFGHLNDPVIARALDFPAVMAEIDAERPVCCHIAWSGQSNGHFVVIVGYDRSNNDIVVCDPLNTLNGSHAYQGSTTFAGGTWDTTYKTN